MLVKSSLLLYSSVLRIYYLCTTYIGLLVYYYYYAFATKLYL